MSVPLFGILTLVGVGGLVLILLAPIAYFVIQATRERDVVMLVIFLFGVMAIVGFLGWAVVDARPSPMSAQPLPERQR